jgi:hypothetical protein
MIERYATVTCSDTCDNLFGTLFRMAVSPQVVRMRNSVTVTYTARVRKDSKWVMPLAYCKAELAKLRLSI